MAFENAARHYDQALRVLERYPRSTSGASSCSSPSGQAHNRAGALGAGRERLKLALEEAQRRGRLDLLAAAALSWGGVLPSSPPVDAEAVAWLQVVVDAFGPDAPERARALARQAELLHRDTSYEQRRALLDEALAIAHRSDDPALLGSVLTSSGLAMLGPGDGDRLPALAEQIIELSRQTKDDELAFNGWKLLLQGLLAGGRMEETRDVVATVRGWANGCASPSTCASPSCGTRPRPTSRDASPRPGAWSTRPSPSPWPATTRRSPRSS